MTPLDAEIAVSIAKRLPPLNLDERGWGLTYCTELHADRDAWRFKTADELTELGATRDGLYWGGPDGQEWWPLVEGALFYNLEFPMEGKEPKYWVNGAEVRQIGGRRNPDGTSVTEHWRVAWRDVARAVDERTAIAAVLPPKCAAKHTAPTTWGGSLPRTDAVRLGALMSSFAFDARVRMAGKGHLTYAGLDSIPVPRRDRLRILDDAAADLLSHRNGEHTRDFWQEGELCALIDARVARAYGLSLREYGATLSSFPLIDRAQPMLPGEPKSFVTRDFALLTYASELGEEPPDIVELLESAGIELPSPRRDLRRLDVRVERYREIGAIPYRPTPKGGRPPTDPALIEAVMEVLNEEPQTVETIAEVVEEKEIVVKRVLESLVKEGECFASGSGAHPRLLRDRGVSCAPTVRHRRSNAGGISPLCAHQLPAALCGARDAARQAGRRPRSAVDRAARLAKPARRNRPRFDRARLATAC